MRRDAYRQQLGAEAMHAGVVRTYVDASLRLLAPIAPHWADHVWREVLRAGDCVLTAGWPELPPADAALRMAAEYVDKLIPKLRGAIDKKEAPPKKKKGAFCSSATRVSYFAAWVHRWCLGPAWTGVNVTARVSCL